MATTWWIVVPSLSEQNVTATPSDAIIATVSDTSIQYHTWLNTDSGGASYNGKTYYRRMGPFTSLSDAQNAYNTGATNASTPIPGVDITPGGGITTSNPLSGITGIAHGIAAISGVIKGIWDTLTNWRMWASLGWLVLGVVLLIAGMLMWKGKQIAQVAPGPVGTAARSFGGR